MTRADDNEAWWQDRREEARREADDVPRRRKLYRCPDRTCGGLDCASCYGEQAAAQYLAEEAEEAEQDAPAWDMALMKAEARYNREARDEQP